mmetsp:Transcript_77593/g.153924  ORF Transcript_77593/g.153924 Transcript_77593/m.153924 type:complete len:212 (-) Transcript_77593:140-775(-)
MAQASSPSMPLAHPLFGYASATVQGAKCVHKLWQYVQVFCHLRCPKHKPTSHHAQIRCQLWRESAHCHDTCSLCSLPFPGLLHCLLWNNYRQQHRYRAQGAPQLFLLFSRVCRKPCRDCRRPQSARSSRVSVQFCRLQQVAHVCYGSSRRSSAQVQGFASFAIDFRPFCEADLWGLAPPIAATRIAHTCQRLGRLRHIADFSPAFAANNQL